MNPIETLQSARRAAQSPPAVRTREGRDGSHPRRRSRGVRAGRRFAAGRAAAGLGAWLGTHAPATCCRWPRRRGGWAARCCSICRGSAPRRRRPDAWGTADYADAVAEFLAGPAARAPHLDRALVRLPRRVAARGAPSGAGRRAFPDRRRRAAAHRARCRSALRIAARRLAFRLARRLTPEGPRREALRARFGSADYARAGPHAPDPGQGGRRGFERGRARGRAARRCWSTATGTARPRPRSAPGSTG